MENIQILNLIIACLSLLGVIMSALSHNISATLWAVSSFILAINLLVRDN